MQNVSEWSRCLQAMDQMSTDTKFGGCEENELRYWVTLIERNLPKHIFDLFCEEVVQVQVRGEDSEEKRDLTLARCNGRRKVTN